MAKYDSVVAEIAHQVMNYTKLTGTDTGKYFKIIHGGVPEFYKRFKETHLTYLDCSEEDMEYTIDTVLKDEVKYLKPEEQEKYRVWKQHNGITD